MASLSSRTPDLRPATLKDLQAIPEDDRFHEVLDGELVEKEATSGQHSLPHGEALIHLAAYRGRPNGPSRPGGWWLVPEPTIQLSPHQIVRPDLAGWRRDRMPDPPSGYPVCLRPDWVCEIHFKKDARRRDTLQKRRIYAEAGIPYFWLIDAAAHTLTVLHLVEGIMVDLQRAGLHDPPLAAEPFPLAPIPVAALFGMD